MTAYAVKPINKATAEAVVKAKHYSGRLGIFWEAFGLFDPVGLLIGVCVFGQPSAPIQKHAFRDREFRLYELTRLVVDAGHANGASTLIAGALRLLKHQPCAVISYADSAHGHCGIVYQATNWLYTGATVAHDVLYMIDGVPTHGMSVCDRFGITNAVAWAKANGITMVKPGPKHRYFQFVGNRRDVRNMRAKLNYPVIAAYPKVAKSLYASPSSCAATAHEQRVTWHDSLA